MSIKRAFTIAFALVLVLMGVQATLDPDLWWHLRTGELIWQEGIPRHDPFSLTRFGVEWVTHEWLSEAIMWPVVASGGLAALSLLFAVLAAVAFLLVYLSCPGRPYLAGAVTLLAAYASSPAFGARPQIMNMLFLAAFAFVVDRVRRGILGDRHLLILPVLMAVWANLHSGYLVGVVMLLTVAVGEAVERFLAPTANRGEQRRAATLAACAIACLFAALLNPNGWHLWTYPFATLGSDLMQQNIVEWMSPDFHSRAYWPFAAMLLLGAAAWAFAPRRPTIPDLLLFLGTAAAGLLSRRHIALFAIIAAPIIARSLHQALLAHPFYANLCRPDDRPVPRVASILNWGIVIGALLGVLAWSSVKLAANESRIAAEFPVAAVDFLERENLAERRIFNTYAWGGYLIWRGIRPFVDGRADVYGEFLGEYLKTFRLTSQWREPLDAHAVEVALVEQHSSLVALLLASGEWREVYRDAVASVLVRNDA